MSNIKYYKINVNLPNTPTIDTYIIQLEDYDKEETSKTILDIITSKHEDTVDTAKHEEETGVEYDYEGSFEEISKEDFEEMLEDGIEEELL